jgi:hypothetical protein
MVLELKMLALREGFVTHIVHIAGTQMIMQGTDRLSRGELQLGSLLNQQANTVPLHLDPITRSLALIKWLETWMGTKPDICTPANKECPIMRTGGIGIEV